MRYRVVPLVAVLFAGCTDGGGGGSGAPALRGQSVRVQAGATASVCISLSTGGVAVAATQNDLEWDPNCLALADRCTIEPATGKQLMSNQLGPGRLRAIAISLQDVNPIPDGTVYCCPFRPQRGGGCCAIGIAGPHGSDPQGLALTMSASDGEVCVE